MKVSAQPKLYLLARTGRRLPPSAGAGWLPARGDDGAQEVLALRFRTLGV